MQEQADPISAAPNDRPRFSRGLFGYAGVFAALAGGALIASIAWWRADVPTAGGGANPNSAAAVEKLEQRLGGLEQRFGQLEQRTTDLQAASQAASTKSEALVTEFKVVVEQLEALTAKLLTADVIEKLPAAGQLEEQIAELQKTAARAELLVEKLTTLDQQAAARLTDLQASLERAPEAVRPAAAAPPRRTGPANRARGRQDGVSGEGGAPVTTAIPPPVTIEPAAGPAAGGRFWERWPDTRMENTGTEGAESAR
jgi:hypothetical protein